MRLIQFLFLYLISTSVYGQNHVFYERLDTVTCNPIAEGAVTDALIDVLGFNQGKYEELILTALNQRRKLKRLEVLKQDEAFYRITNVGVNSFPQRFLRNKKYHSKIRKHATLGLKHLSGENRLFKVFVLNVSLVNLRRGERFFYSRGDETTELKLFKGKRPRTMNPDHPEYEELYPVKPLTELELMKRVMQEIKRNRGMKSLLSKYYTHMGVHIRLDENTISRKKVPSAYIMIIIGGKQTQRIQEKEIPNLDNEDDNSLYNLLK